MAADHTPIPIDRLADTLGILGTGLAVDGNGRPDIPLVIVDLDAPATADEVARAVSAVTATQSVVIGLARQRPHGLTDPLGAALDCTVVAGDVCESWQIAVPDPAFATQLIASAVQRAPVAAMTLARVLDRVAALSVADGLAAESAAYSMLLAGAEFRSWLATRPPGKVLPRPDCPVLIERCDDTLTVTLNVPERHNAFSRWVRDGLVEAMDLVITDDTIRGVVLRGAGPSFCSGGDLDEFGSTTDPALAHLIRLDRSVAARLHRCRDRVTVELHGFCIGAGIEVASFAGHVRVRRGATIALPELSMGLIPGAGGTVGLTRRIGRWRTAYLVLTGAAIDPDRALAWGLVDAVIDE